MVQETDSLYIERVRRRVRQRDVADALGITPQTMIDIERGRITVDQATHDRILNAIRQKSGELEPA